MNKTGPMASVKMQKCIECGGNQMATYGNGRTVCMECGFVAANADGEHRRNSRIEHREKNGEKTFTNSLRAHDNNLIVKRYSITACPSRQSASNEKFQNSLLEGWWNYGRISNQTEKNLALAFAEITRIGINLNLPRNVMEKAAAIYKRLLENNHLKGRNIKALSAATIYMACKQCGHAKTLNEITSLSGASKEKISRDYKFLIMKNNALVPLIKPGQYAPRISDQLALSHHAKEIVNKILNVADKLKLTTGRNPVSMAAAAIYIASMLTGEDRTQREIAEIAHMTEATIRNRYKELEKRLLFVVTI